MRLFESKKLLRLNEAVKKFTLVVDEEYEYADWEKGHGLYDMLKKMEKDKVIKIKGNFESFGEFKIFLANGKEVLYDEMDDITDQLENTEGIEIKTKFN